MHCDCVLNTSGASDSFEDILLDDRCSYGRLSKFKIYMLKKNHIGSSYGEELQVAESDAIMHKQSRKPINIRKNRYK
uniref:Uncharacterized protein n=1 Tax=Romanomermis culicivorax TaxID=13658 RepID=A0A915JHV1_ROMCU